MKLTKISSRRTLVYSTMLALHVLPFSSVSAEQTASPGQSVANASIDKSKETAPRKQAFNFSNTNSWPIDSAIRQGAGRYGEERSSSSATGWRSHGGIDISPTASGKGDVLLALNSGTVLNINQGSTNAISIRLDNGDVVSYLHTGKALVKGGQRVTKKQPIGIMGSAGTTNVHLHISYATRSGNGFQTHLGFKNLQSVYTGSGRLKRFTSTGQYAASGKLVLTNPAPYLPEDVLFIFGSSNDRGMTQYLGNTARTQWNALYSEATGISLPLSGCVKTRSGCAPVVRGKPFPKPKLVDGMVGNLDAYAAASATIAQGLADGEIPAEYADDTYVSPSEIAVYLKPRTIFGGNPDDMPVDVGDNSYTPSEQISHLASSRYGNAEWADNMMRMSMRGMLTEYLNIVNGSNYLTKEHFKQQERIEALLAAYVAQRAQRFSGYVDKAYTSAVSPTVIPTVSTIPVEKLFSEGFDPSSLPPGTNLDAVITNASGGTVPRVCKGNVGLNNPNFPGMKEYIRTTALNHSMNPNDLAAVIGFESNFRRDNRNSSGAAGLLQWTPTGVADITNNHLQEVGLYPKYQKVKNSKNQWAFVGGHQPTILKMTTPEQFSLMHPYFKIKLGSKWAKGNKQSGLADIRYIYPLVLGTATYYKGDRNGYYEANAGMDTNNDGQITPAEAALSPNMHIWLCKYFPEYP